MMVMTAVSQLVPKALSVLLAPNMLITLQAEQVLRLRNMHWKSDLYCEEWSEPKTLSLAPSVRKQRRALDVTMVLRWPSPLR